MGRGGIGNEADLIAALKDGASPPPGQTCSRSNRRRPKMAGSASNLFLSPHHASVTQEAYAAIVDRDGDRIEEFLARD